LGGGLINICSNLNIFDGKCFFTSDSLEVFFENEIKTVILGINKTNFYVFFFKISRNCINIFIFSNAIENL
jgi:hypothetical protein